MMAKFLSFRNPGRVSNLTLGCIAGSYVVIRLGIFSYNLLADSNEKTNAMQNYKASIDPAEIVFIATTAADKTVRAAETAALAANESRDAAKMATMSSKRLITNISLAVAVAAAEATAAAREAKLFAQSAIETANSIKGDAAASAAAEATLAAREARDAAKVASEAAYILINHLKAIQRSPIVTAETRALAVPAEPKYLENKKKNKGGIKSLNKLVEICELSELCCNDLAAVSMVEMPKKKKDNMDETVSVMTLIGF